MIPGKVPAVQMEVIRGFKKNFLKGKIAVCRRGFQDLVRIENKETLDAGVEENEKQDEKTQNDDGLKKGHRRGKDLLEPHCVYSFHDNRSMRMLDLKVKSAYILFERFARVNSFQDPGEEE